LATINAVKIFIVQALRVTNSQAFKITVVIKTVKKFYIIVPKSDKYTSYYIAIIKTVKKFCSACPMSDKYTSY
jgi:hypothetical protein